MVAFWFVPRRNFPGRTRRKSGCAWSASIHGNELKRDFRSSRCVGHFVISPNRLAATTLRLLCFLFSRVSLLPFSWLHFPPLWCIPTTLRIIFQRPILTLRTPPQHTCR